MSLSAFSDVASKRVRILYWFFLCLMSFVTAVAQTSSPTPSQAAPESQPADRPQPVATQEEKPSPLAGAIPDNPADGSTCHATQLPPSWDVTTVMPMSIYEGTAVTLRLTGEGLGSISTIILCSKSSKKGSPAPYVEKLDAANSSPTKLQTAVSAIPDSAGDYYVYVTDSAGTVYDTKKLLEIVSSEDTKYVSCSAPANHGKPNAGLACSFVPLSYQTELEVFGKGVANRFIAVEVTVQNKRTDLEFLLQDMRVGTPDFIVSSYDKKIPRAVSEKAEQFSARAIVLRLTAAGASILTGISGFAGNEILMQAAGIAAGPFQTGLQSSIPNLSTAELARLDDLGFSTAATVISKNASIAVVGFIPSDTLNSAANWKPKVIARPFKWLRPSQNSFSTYKGDELTALFASLQVQVAGIHVQEVNPSQPALKTFIPPNQNTSFSLKTLQGGYVFTIQGSELSAVTQVELTLDSKTVISTKLQALTGTSIDPTVAQLPIPKSASYTIGKYEIKFNLADGSTVDTQQAITVVSP